MPKNKLCKLCKEHKCDPKIMYDFLSDIDFTSTRENEICLDPEEFHQSASGFGIGTVLARSPFDRTRFRLYHATGDCLSSHIFFDGYIFFDGTRIIFSREHPLVFKYRKMSRWHRRLLLHWLRFREWLDRLLGRKENGGCNQK